jgi:hypothetical protein
MNEWKNEKKTWSGVSGFEYNDIECKHKESEKEVKF